MDPDRPYLNCRSTRLDSDHTLVPNELSRCFDERPKRIMQRRLDCGKLFDSTSLPIFRSALTEKLELPSPKQINEHWSYIKKPLHPAGFLSCGLKRCVMTPWISIEFLHHPNAPQSSPVGREHSETRINSRREINASS